jgi:hypothetical protein
MKTRARKFQNRLLPIGGRAFESMELLEFRDIVSGMKRELRCLLRENIRLHLSDTPDAGCAKALRRDIEDLIRHLVLDARDAMPAGGAVCILTGTVALARNMRGRIRRFHPAIMQCSRSAIPATGRMSQALKRWDRKPPSARLELSDSRPAMVSSINSEGTSVSRGTRARR